MGITSKFRQMFKKDLPIDNGNSKMTQLQFDAIETKLKSTMTQAISSYDAVVSKKMEGKIYSVYQLMLMQANYFVNVHNFYFDLTRENHELNIVLREAKLISFIYGKSVIFKRGDIFYSGYIKEQKVVQGSSIPSEVTVIAGKNILIQQTATINTEGLEDST
ncbi:MAG: hypothetical protein ACRCXY_11420 [Fusobacteriaceae bacterium]